MSRMSPFLQLVTKAIDVKPEIHAALVEQFVRGGGTVTLTEWLNMTGEDRAELVHQREEWMIDIAGMIFGTPEPEVDSADTLADAMADAVVEARRE